jgi:hypothetical protein
MVKLKGSTVQATLLGDVVGSRTSADRRAVHRRLGVVLADANERFEAVGALRIPAGDEFQGSFATVGHALAAAVWIRLQLRPEVDIRQGVGWGAVSVLEEEPRIEDGPGWWAARLAIDEVKAQARSAGTRRARTAYRLVDGVAGPDPDPVNAALLLRDHLLGGLSERSMRLLAGLLDGASQSDLAAAEGISGSAVSQRVRGDGLAAIIAASELLGGVA